MKKIPFFPERQVKLLKILSTGEMMTVEALAEATKATRQQTHGCLERLRVAGHVAREILREGSPYRPAYLYSITGKGKKRLKYLVPDPPKG